MITVHAEVYAPLSKVWDAYNEPEAIQQWNHAGPDWFCPHSENNLRVGGRFKHTMAAKDGSFSFDFSGKYDVVDTYSVIEYTLDDSRIVKISFSDLGDFVSVDITFETEQINTEELQRAGWQAILDNFKRYAEEA